jgi:hypothetical protein
VSHEKQRPLLPVLNEILKNDINIHVAALSTFLFYRQDVWKQTIIILTRIQSTQKGISFFTLHKIRLFQSTGFEICYVRAAIRYVGVEGYYLVRRLSCLCYCIVTITTKSMEIETLLVGVRGVINWNWVSISSAVSILRAAVIQTHQDKCFVWMPGEDVVTELLFSVQTDLAIF